MIFEGAPRAGLPARGPSSMLPTLCKHHMVRLPKHGCPCFGFITCCIRLPGCQGNREINPVLTLVLCRESPFTVRGPCAFSLLGSIFPYFWKMSKFFLTFAQASCRLNMDRRMGTVTLSACLILYPLTLRRKVRVKPYGRDVVCGLAVWPV